MKGLVIENPVATGLRRSWRFAGSPVDGTSGTLAGVADPGDILIDTTNKKLYINTNTAASPTWSQVLTAGVAFAGDLTITGDVDVTGDIDIGSEDLSVDQGRFVYLDGQDGAEYITSDAANALMINATTTMNLAIGGTDTLTLTASELDLSGASITLDDGYSVKWGADTDMDMFWYAGGPYFWFKLLADIDIQWGESGIGAQYTWHQKAAQQNMILGGGALTLNTTYIRMQGATGAGLIVAVTGGGDGVRFESATLGNAIDFEATCTITTGINMAAAATTHISISGASNTALLIAASAGVIDVNDTTASTSVSTGSINTAGGLGVALDLFMGGDLYIASGKKIDFNAGDVTLTHSAKLLTLDGSVTQSVTLSTSTGANGMRMTVLGYNGTVGSSSGVYGRVKTAATSVLDTNAAWTGVMAWADFSSAFTMGSGNNVSALRAIFELDSTDLRSMAGGGESSIIYAQMWAGSGAIDFGLRIVNGTSATIGAAISLGGAGTWDRIFEMTELADGERMLMQGSVLDVSGRRLNIYMGDLNTRAAVRAQVGDLIGMGSLYLSSTGKMFIKVAGATADTDWEVINSEASDTA